MAGWVLLLHDAHVVSGDYMAITGEAPELGTWDVSKTLALKTCPEMYPTWTVELPPLASGSEFKFVCVSGSGEIRWEPIVGNHAWPHDLRSKTGKISFTFGQDGVDVAADATSCINDFVPACSFQHDPIENGHVQIEAAQKLPVSDPTWILHGGRWRKTEKAVSQVEAAAVRDASSTVGDVAILAAVAGMNKLSITESSKEKDLIESVFEPVELSAASLKEKSVSFEGHIERLPLNTVLPFWGDCYAVLDNDLLTIYDCHDNDMHLIGILPVAGLQIIELSDLKWRLEIPLTDAASQDLLQCVFQAPNEDSAEMWKVMLRRSAEVFQKLQCPMSYGLPGA